jgi:hypothetical protein
MMTAKARKKYFPCMKSNFKTLMIKIMSKQNSRNFTRNLRKGSQDPGPIRSGIPASGILKRTGAAKAWMTPIRFG